MIIFVERNKVDISEFINDLKRTILRTERSLKINLDVMRDKVNVIEEMHRIMCEQDKKIKMFENSLDSEISSVLQNDETELNSKSLIESLKEENSELSKHCKGLSALISEKKDEILALKLKYDSLVDQGRELRFLNLDKAEKNINLEVDKKKLYDELQKEKAINRDLEMQLKILLRAMGLGW